MAGHQCAGHKSATPSVTQTLDEMDFERGIWSAAFDGDLSTLLSKLRSGDDPNACDSSGYTALHYASRNGHTDACRTLIDYGAKVNAQTRSGGVTPLHRSSYQGHFEVSRLLIDRGADVSLLDNDGKTPLHKAAEKNREDIARLLLMENPELLPVRDKRNKTAAEYGLTKELNDKIYLNVNV